MIEIRELADIEYFDVNVSNHKTLDPLDVWETGKQVRVMIAMTDLPTGWAFEEVTRSKIVCVYPQLTAWMVFAAVIVVVSQDGRQRVLDSAT